MEVGEGRKRARMARFMLFNESDHSLTSGATVLSLCSGSMSQCRIESRALGPSSSLRAARVCCGDQMSRKAPRTFACWGSYSSRQGGVGCEYA